METVFDRMMQAAQELEPGMKMTKARLKDLIGESAQTLTNWQNRGVPAAKITSLARTLGVLSEWLESGTGPKRMDDLGPAIETPMRPVVVVETQDDIKHDIIEVPRYTLKASAGNGQPVLEIDREGTPNYCRAGWARHNGYKPELLFSMRMTGISMQPTIPDGASLIVHRQQEIESGRIHIICRDGECFVKRLYKQMDGSLLIHSDNDQAYKDILLQPGDPIELHVVGLVVTMSTNL